MVNNVTVARLFVVFGSYLSIRPDPVHSSVWAETSTKSFVFITEWRFSFVLVQPLLTPIQDRYKFLELCIHVYRSSEYSKQC